MLKKWLAIFKKNILMDRAYKRSFEMLDISMNMYEEAKKCLRHQGGNEAAQKVLAADIELKKYEAEIRYNVFNHLAVKGPADLPSGLALILILVDIERIGDYSRYMVELAQEYPGKLQGGNFEDKVAQIEAALQENFVQTKNCLKDGDAASAWVLIDKFDWIKNGCDKIIASVVKEKEQGTESGTPAALVLYVSWLKRIHIHFLNIASSVVDSFDHIGIES